MKHKIEKKLKYKITTYHGRKQICKSNYSLITLELQYVNPVINRM